MDEPGIELEYAIKKIAEGVMQDTGDKQVPWSEGIIIGHFYFVPRLFAVPVPDPRPHPAADPELMFWSSVSQCGTVGCFRSYLETYPRGRFSALAKAQIRRLDELRPGVAPSEPKPHPKRQLALCRQHFAANRLTTGTGGTALECYRGVLDKSPDNEDAMKGIEAIVDRYLGWARSNLERKRIDKALAHLAKAEAARRTQQEQERAAVERRCRKGREPEMVRIAGGSFQMGSPPDEDGRESDKKRHWVQVDDFGIGKYEVTFEEYDHFAKASDRKLPRDRGWGRGRRPVINVSWIDAVSYAEWLSGQTGQRYRLPTEAEWEYAARAGTDTPFSTGRCIATDQANYDGRYDYKGCGAKAGGDRAKTVPVDSLAQNPWGLYHVQGNAWEWTCSAYDKGYGGDEKRCEANNHAGQRAFCGGSWNSRPVWVRSANRDRNALSLSYDLIGFRLAQD